MYRRRRFGRFARKRGRFSRRRGAYRKRFDAGRKALALVKKMESDKEIKYGKYTVNETIAIAGNAGQEMLVNALGQGDAYNQRVGDIVTSKDVMCDVNIHCTNAETQGCLVKLVLVYDKKPAGVQCVWEDLYDDANFNAPIDIRGAERGRFKILYSKTFTMGGNAPLTRNVKFFKKLFAKCDYSLGVAGTIADFQKNSLVLMMNSVNNAGTIDVDGYVRFRFTDD